MIRGYRKYSITVLALVFAFVLGLLQRLTAEFATIASICVGAFHAANALKKPVEGYDDELSSK